MKTCHASKNSDVNTVSQVNESGFLAQKPPSNHLNPAKKNKIKKGFLWYTFLPRAFLKIKILLFILSLRFFKPSVHSCEEFKMINVTC